MVVGVQNIELAFRVLRESPWLIELARFFAVGSPGSQQFAISSELLNTVVSVLRNIDGAVLA